MTDDFIERLKTALNHCGAADYEAYGWEFRCIMQAARRFVALAETLPEPQEYQHWWGKADEYIASGHNTLLSKVRKIMNGETT